MCLRALCSHKARWDLSEHESSVEKLSASEQLYSEKKKVIAPK
jgi:hypothetical protein